MTGLRALAAAIVSFWICIREAILNFRSVVVGLPRVDEGAGGAVDELPAETADGSDVIRSISVVPAES